MGVSKKEVTSVSDTTEEVAFIVEDQNEIGKGGALKTALTLPETGPQDRVTLYDEVCDQEFNDFVQQRLLGGAPSNGYTGDPSPHQWSKAEVEIDGELNDVDPECEKTFQKCIPPKQTGSEIRDDLSEVKKCQNTGVQGPSVSSQELGALLDHCKMLIHTNSLLDVPNQPSQLIQEIEEKSRRSFRPGHGCSFNPPLGSNFGGVFKVLLKATRRAPHVKISKVEQKGRRFLGGILVGWGALGGKSHLWIFALRVCFTTKISTMRPKIFQIEELITITFSVNQVFRLFDFNAWIFAIVLLLVFGIARDILLEEEEHHFLLKEGRPVLEESPEDSQELLSEGELEHKGWHLPLPGKNTLEVQQHDSSDLKMLGNWKAPVVNMSSVPKLGKWKNQLKIVYKNEDSESVGKRPPGFEDSRSSGLDYHYPRWQAKLSKDPDCKEAKNPRRKKNRR